MENDIEKSREPRNVTQENDSYPQNTTKQSIQGRNQLPPDNTKKNTIAKQDQANRTLHRGDKVNAREKVRRKTESSEKHSKKVYCWIAASVVFVAVMALVALAIAVLAMHHVDTLRTQLEQNIPVQSPQRPPPDMNETIIDKTSQLTAIYTRWGSSTCPQTPGNSFVYQGLMAGQRNMSGEAKGGTNFQCLPLTTVEYTLPSQPGTQGEVVIYGTEYSNTVKPDSNHHNVPCAVCLVRGRVTVAMIPATTACPQSWTREYYGYLMAQKNDYSTYECVDKVMDTLTGTVHKENIALLAHVEASCTLGSGIECSPYVEGKELNCVVCSI